MCSLCAFANQLFGYEEDLHGYERHSLQLAYVSATGDLNTNFSIAGPFSPLRLTPDTCNAGVGRARVGWMTVTLGTTTNYLWSNGATTSSIRGLHAGENHSVTVTDNYGCSVTASGTIGNETNTMSMGPLRTKPDTCNTGVGRTRVGLLIVTLGTTTNYQWSNGATTSYIHGLQSGSTHSLTVSDNYGCSLTATTVIGNVDENCGGNNKAEAVEVAEIAEEVELISEVSAYPNPFSNTLNFKLSLQKDAEVEITVYDLSGKAQWSLPKQLLRFGEHNLTWNNISGDLPAAGIYFASVKINETVQTVKVVYQQ